MKIFASILLTVLLSAIASGQFPSIGTIDYYGLRTVSEKQIRENLQIKEGDAVFKTKAEKTEIERHLTSIPNVAEVQISSVCCTTDGKTMLYIGIRERESPALIFRTNPNGTIRLPNEIVKAGKDYAEAHQQAVLNGDVAEDRSAGHSLMNNPKARAAQEKFILIANENLNLLRQVLHESADDAHRALAAEIIAYYKDKSVVVSDLVYAMKDANSTVRNNAMRALGLIAAYSFAQPEKNNKIPFEPFVDMLNSIEWTDRNKSSLVLAELTEKRDAELLDLIRRKATPTLIEMAQWKNEGHAGMPFLILGRIAGFSDDEIMRALMTGKRKNLIAEAQKKLKVKP
jgi:hypothetical protein